MTDNERWKAVSENDKNYDGIFLYGVKTTKIFCRPSCKSKLPLKKNTVYFETKEEAEQDGYRPCKRCRPDILKYQPIEEIAEKAKLLIHAYFTERQKLARELERVGASYHRMANIFKEYFCMTPKDYYDNLRLVEAKNKLVNTDEKIINIAYDSGFQSLSAFYNLFRKKWVKRHQNTEMRKNKVKHENVAWQVCLRFDGSRRIGVPFA
jgi:AraC family transcriptional regulator of adaptative response / methylphosphotriester-DNA alkyltransferase methyltransferase